MIYAKFKVLSTGYIPNTIPPQFSDEYKKPIDMCGSDSVYKLDARKTLTTLKADAERRIEKLKTLSPHIIGYDIIRGESYREGRVLYTKIF